jgi:vacuolar-type H+-ATPase subunit E/Vma4
MDIKRGLLAITDEVLGDVQKEARAIILASETEAKETLKVAKEQADKNYKAIIDDAKVKANDEARKIVSVTEVEMRNGRLQTKERLVDAAFSKARVKLKDYVETEQYHYYLLNLIRDVAKEIGQESLKVQVNAKDKVWLTPEILRNLSKKIQIELQFSQQEGDFLGGCKIQTVDGKITYNSTIEDRLEDFKPSLRVEVAKILFGKEV